jgi:hypothetical protein
LFAAVYVVPSVAGVVVDLGMMGMGDLDKIFLKRFIS